MDEPRATVFDNRTIHGRGPEPMTTDFVGKRIIVTGAAGGIGIETVRAFTDLGGHVLLVDRDQERLEQAERTLGKLRIGLHRSDLGSPEACALAMEHVGGPAFALIHLAGVYEEDRFTAEDHGVWDRAIGANLTNAYDMAIAFSTRFAKGKEPAMTYARTFITGVISADLVQAAAGRARVRGAAVIVDSP